MRLRRWLSELVMGVAQGGPQVVHGGGDASAPLGGGVVDRLVDSEGREPDRFLVRREKRLPQPSEVIEHFFAPRIVR